MTSDIQLEIFERAFSGGMGSCRMTCDCGKRYFHDDEMGYDWEPGELADLRANGVPIPYSPGNIVCEGRHYVEACTCWHDRARKIMGFIDGHAHQIADYLNAMKKERQREAGAAPSVDP